MLVVEDSKVEVIGIWNIDPVIEAQESDRVHGPSRIRGIRQVTLPCKGVSRESCKNVSMEVFYIH